MTPINAFSLEIFLTYSLKNLFVSKKNQITFNIICALLNMPNEFY